MLKTKQIKSMSNETNQRKMYVLLDRSNQECIELNDTRVLRRQSEGSVLGTENAPFLLRSCVNSPSDEDLRNQHERSFIRRFAQCQDDGNKLRGGNVDFHRP